MAERFGPYEILAPLATGGMGRVFRARITGPQGFQKVVALKLMMPSGGHVAARQKMFIDEARIAATLSHKNIVQVTDFGERGGNWYLAMEYVSGANLRVLLERALETGRALPAALAAYIAQQVASGLHYAHEKRDETGKPVGIVHRDVSPQNVVVSWDGEVKILDFGIARTVAAEEESGVIKGKFSYMSPEQASGETVDRRSDLFSLGAVLYEMLTGTRAFPGPGPRALQQVRRADYVPPETIVPLPDPLLEVVTRALARDPAARWQTAEEMANALSLWLAQVKVQYGVADETKVMSTWMGGLFQVSERDFHGAPEDRPTHDENEPPSARILSRPEKELTFSSADEVEEIPTAQLAGEADSPAPDVLSPKPVEGPVRPLSAPAASRMRFTYSDEELFWGRAPEKRRDVIAWALGGLVALAIVAALALPLFDADEDPLDASPTSLSWSPVPQATDLVQGTAQVPTQMIGLLSLASIPSGAMTYADSRRLAETPTLIHDLPVPATYRVRFEKEGYFTWSREIDMIDEIRVDVLATLVPIDVPGKILLTVGEGVEAWFDGEKLGVGPGELAGEGSEGEHQLRLKRPGGKVMHDIVLSLRAGHTSELDTRPLTLAPLTTSTGS